MQSTANGNSESASGAPAAATQVTRYSPQLHRHSARSIPWGRQYPALPFQAHVLSTGTGKRVCEKVNLMWAPYSLIQCDSYS